MSFDHLGLAPDLTRAVLDQGYKSPTPIQSGAIPLVLDGVDMLAAAQTGTGKTAAFVLPILQRLAYVGFARPKQIRALVLVPTRELAAQVHESVKLYGRHLSLRSAVVYGGVKIGPQIERLAEGVDILVATPGRLLDLAGQKALEFRSVEVLVLDEADRMLDMGFIHDIKRIVDQLPNDRQTLMFSATFSKDIRALASRYLDSPEVVEVAPANTAAERVEQRVYPVHRSRKNELLIHLLQQEQWHRVLVFTRTKHGANRLCRRLEKEGIEVAAIHGNKSQNARQRALADFKAGSLQVLLATDIAARGLDIDLLPDVVNFDLPAVAEDYVHRIGRTGRAGAAGRSHSFCTDDERSQLRAIERLLGEKIPQVVNAEFDKPSPQFVAAAEVNGAHNVDSRLDSSLDGKENTSKNRRRRRSKPSAKVDVSGRGHASKEASKRRANAQRKGNHYSPSR